MRVPQIILISLICSVEASAQVGPTILIRRGNSAMSMAAAAARGTASQSFVSPNGKFRVLIEDQEPAAARLIKITATMLKGETPNSTTLWRHDSTGVPAGCLVPEDLVISNEGDFFVMASSEERWILFRKDGPPQILQTAPSPRGYRRLPGHEIRMPNDLIAIDRFQSQPIVRIWRSDSDLWEGFRADTGSEIEISSALLERWNNETREAILQKVTRVQRDRMRRRVGQFSPKLSQLATNFVPAVQWREVQDIHYQFLALRRDPRDRPLFEGMLKPQPQPAAAAKAGVFASSRTMLSPNRLANRFTTPPEYFVYDFERMRGDTTLAIFDQKASPTNLMQGLFNRPQFYLGRASGIVKLPAPVVSGATGPLRVWLVPADKLKKNWLAAGAELMEADLKDPRGVPSSSQNDIAFTFVNVLPGQYSLKAIWDKRPAHEDREKAGPGDYESNWIGPITITAGNTTSNIVAGCTNRAPTGGETYYAADELASRRARQ